MVIIQPNYGSGGKLFDISTGRTIASISRSGGIYLDGIDQMLIDSFGFRAFPVEWIKTPPPYYYLLGLKSTGKTSYPDLDALDMGWTGIAALNPFLIELYEGASGLFSRILKDMPKPISVLHGHCVGGLLRLDLRDQPIVYAVTPVAYEFWFYYPEPVRFFGFGSVPSHTYVRKDNVHVEVVGLPQ